MAKLTDKERQTIVDMIDQGVNRNEIARKVGRSPGTITNVARSAGKTFDRTATKKATAARQADNASRRSQLVSDLLGDAEKLRTQLWEPCKVFNFGGRDNSYNEVELNEPTFADKRNIMATVKLAINGLIDLEAVDKGYDGLPAILELVGTLRRKRDDGDAA